MFECTRCGELKPEDRFSLTGRGYRNGKCKACMVDLSREWRAKNPERNKANRRKGVLANYGLTPAEYDALVELQDDCCALCGEPLKGRVVVDHDHGCCPGPKSCGSCVRGVIHHKCNVLLGMADDSIPLLQGAIDYLERTSHAN